MVGIDGEEVVMRTVRIQVIEAHGVDVLGIGIDYRELSHDGADGLVFHDG